MGATRYPCMPSLVALQQMRNRLHLAYLGKKLMKWTALATGRELRKIAQDIQISYGDFGEDIRSCYILLARSRYFYPNLNKMVIENAPQKASIRVTTLTKTVAGVKILQYEIIDTGEDPYEHLAIEKGGQIVKKTKDAWLDLLKRMIMIVQLRQGFQNVDEANKTATKRQNVLAKTVIPRIKSSIHYIVLELEELAREELYRIKKVVEYKNKKKAKIAQTLKAKTSKVLFTEEDKLSKGMFTEEDWSATCCLLPKPEPKPIPLAPIPVAPKPTPPEKIESKPKEEERPVEITSRLSHVCILAGQSAANYLKEQLATVISLSKDLMRNKTSKIDFGSFLQHCEQVKVGMDEAFHTEKTKGITDKDLLARLEHLKSHLRAVIDVTQEFREKVTISPSVECFSNLCQTVYDKIDLYFQASTKPGDVSKRRLEHLKEHIKDTEEITEDFKKQGIVTTGAEKFLDACSRIKSKIDTYNDDMEKTEKLEHLKEHVTNLEKLTSVIKAEGMTSNSIEEFLTACNEFKARIERYRNVDKAPPPESEITKLMSQIDTAIELSKKAKESGLVSDSVQDFIKSCEDVRKRLEQKGKVQKNPILDELKDNLDDVVKLMSMLKAKGTLTASVEEFLKACEQTKSKIENYENPLHNDEPDGRLIYPTLEPKSDFQIDPNSCEKHKEMWIEEGSMASSIILPPCLACSDNKTITTTPSSPSKTTPRGITTPSMTTDKKPAEIITPTISESLCTSCDESVDKSLDSENTIKSEESDDDLGLFEKKVKTLVKIIRSLNPDGTVKEEKVVTTIITERHDPNETKFDIIGSKTSSRNSN